MSDCTSAHSDQRATLRLFFEIGFHWPISEQCSSLIRLRWYTGPFGLDCPIGPSAIFRMAHRVNKNSLPNEMSMTPLKPTLLRTISVGSQQPCIMNFPKQKSNPCSPLASNLLVTPVERKSLGLSALPPPPIGAETNRGGLFFGGEADLRTLRSDLSRPCSKRWNRPSTRLEASKMTKRLRRTPSSSRRWSRRTSE